MSIPNAAPRSVRLCKRARGLSLIELLIFIVIISIAVVAILRVQVQANLMSADPQLQKQALVIAESLLEEISLAKFSFCDPTDPVADTASSSAECSIPEVAGQETGAVAASDCATPVERTFDNVSDFVDTFGMAKTYTADALGVCLPVGYEAKVTITPDASLGPTGSMITSDSTPANSNVFRISVKVTYSRGEVVVDGYRTRYAPNVLP